MLITRPLQPFNSPLDESAVADVSPVRRSFNEGGTSHGTAARAAASARSEPLLGSSNPVLIFSVGHCTSGWPNIIAALVAGSILAVFYQWRRDLLANMIGHFLVDFIGVLVPRFFS